MKNKTRLRLENDEYELLVLNEIRLDIADITTSSFKYFTLSVIFSKIQFDLDQEVVC